MPESIYIPDWGEFELPEWLAGKDIEITDVTWREKIQKVNSSYDAYIEYQANAPNFLITDFAIVIIYDLDLNLTFSELLEIINGNYTFLIDQLKDPTLLKYTFSEMNGRWETYIDMEAKKVFMDTYVIVGLYIDLEAQKICRDAEMITYQSIKIKSFEDEAKENKLFAKFEKPFYFRLLSSIISAVQRATLPDTLGHLST